MKQFRFLSVFSKKFGETGAKDRLEQHFRKQILVLVIATIVSVSARASITCKGHFVNPVTDICWSCLLPISIGGINIGKGATPKKRDRANPSSPLCLCTKSGVPIPGVSIGFWEPVRLVDVTRTPYCMVNLGGIQFGNDPRKISSSERGHDRRNTHTSFYHVHYYVYPLIYWLELLTDFLCLEEGTVDVAYMSEFDITWNDPKIQSLLNPEAILFGNPIAQATCTLDCAASTFDMPLEPMFWCAGCWGNMYPFSGANSDHIGGVQNSSLLAYRIITKMHRLGLAQSTATSDASINGEICRKHRAFKIKKKQYKLQLVNPKSTKGDIGCWPLGLSDMLYSSFKEYPYDGQDWGYLIWRKKKLLFLVTALLCFGNIAKAEEKFEFKAEDLKSAQELLEKSRQITLPNIEAKWLELQNMLGNGKTKNNLGNESLVGSESRREWGTSLRIFVSNSMSRNLLKAYAKAAKQYGAVLVFNGLPQGSWRKLSELVTEISGNDPELVTIQIDNEAFDLFGIKEVPSFVLSKEEGALIENPKVIFDKVSGSIGISSALELFADNGELKELAGKLLKREGSE